MPANGSTIQKESDDRLTEPNYWQSIYDSSPQPAPVQKKTERPGSLSRILSKLAGVENLDISYADDTYLNVLLPRYIGSGYGRRLLEIGAAPGQALRQMNELFGFEPFGVEYTSRGAEQARATLASVGFSGDHIFECDAFSPEFRDRHRDAYDVVMSLGFIEHFTDVKAVVRHHIDLLAPGGLLLIRIPRLRGVNQMLAKLIDPASLDIHNLDIMQLGAFRCLFDFPDMEGLYSGYQGTMHLVLSDKAHGRVAGKLAVSATRKIQLLANAVMHRALAGRPLECSALSPFLVYIGRKKRLSP